MDKGTGVYTSYDLDNRFIDYLMEDPKRMKYKVGHIHSHNVMNVFFSGTDMAELNDSAPAYNYYLSLIVNNYMEMTAKVAFVANATATIQKVDYLSLDETGQPYAMEQKDFTFQKQKLYVYNCDITVPSVDISVEESFSKQVATLLIPKKVIPKPVYKPVTPVVNKAAPVVGKQFVPVVNKQEIDVADKYKDFFNGIDFKNIEDYEDEEYEENAEKLMSFAISLFSNSTQPLEDETLEDVLLVLVDSETDPIDVARKALEDYASKYVLAFPDNDDVDFVTDAYEILDILYDVPSTMTSIINPTITVIERMVKAFQNDTRTV